jgi:hypothetical protein
MKKAFHFLVVVFVTFVCGVIILNQLKFRAVPAPEVSSIQSQESITDDLTEYNKSVATVKNITTDIQIEQNMLSLSGSLVYEKPDNFKLSVYSTLGLESEIGSNSTKIWFWSKRYSNSLFYALKEDVSKSNLKPQFDPEFLRSLLGVTEFKGNYQIKKYNNQLVIYQQTADVIDVTLLTADKKGISGRYLYHASGAPISSVEVIEFQTIEGVVLPKKLKATLFEEDKTIIWVLNNTLINKDLSAINWNEPNIHPKIGMKDINK